MDGAVSNVCGKHCFKDMFALANVGHIDIYYIYVMKYHYLYGRLFSHNKTSVRIRRFHNTFVLQKKGNGFYHSPI